MPRRTLPVMKVYRVWMNIGGHVGVYDGGALNRGYDRKMAMLLAAGYRKRNPDVRFYARGSKT